MIMLAGMVLPARAVARQLNLPVLTLTPLVGSAAGLFTLVGAGCGPACGTAPIESTDIAFVARTSGTTARSKPEAASERSRPTTGP